VTEPNYMIANSTLNSIFDALHDLFDPILDSESNKTRADDLENWMFRVLPSDDGTPHYVHNLRVATSIAFEAKTGNVPAQYIYDHILNRENLSGEYFITSSGAEPAHIQFDKACFFNLPPTVIGGTDYAAFQSFYAAAFMSVNHPPEGYARCVNFPGFFTYFVTMDENYKTKSLKMKDYLREFKWAENYNVSVDFPKIPAANNVNMRGLKPLAWIAPYSSLQPLLHLPNPPLELAQQLGIFIKNNASKDPLYYDVLMLINYDKNFDETVYQPASIHADWQSGGFVSYKQNTSCYGLTYNCYHGTIKSIPERIHISFPVITVGPGAYSHSAIIVGRVDQAVKLDYQKILAETILRFQTL
jgi:hypothetical protein